MERKTCICLNNCRTDCLLLCINWPIYHVNYLGSYQFPLFFSCICTMESKSCLMQSKGNGVQGKQIHGNGVHRVTMMGTIKPAELKARNRQWNIQASEMSRKTLNPIRAIVDCMKLTPNPDKPMIALSIGETNSHIVHNKATPDNFTFRFCPYP